MLPAVKAWAAKLDQNDPQYEHNALEALWTTWGLNQADDALLRQLLAAKDFHARAAAVRVLRYNMHRIADHAALFEKAAVDPHGRVRLEAIVAASWMTDTAAAKKIVETASKQPLDVWSQAAAKTAADRLAGIAEKPQAEFTVVPAPDHLDAAAKKQFVAGQEVYNREGLCMTCHRGDGGGLPPAFPSIASSPWVTEDKERLIKLVLFGLMGPLEVNGKKFDGQVPMTPFAGMLKDEEVANVLTFVRNHFGNKADAVSAAEVKAVRSAQPGRMMFYTVDELLKQHPMKK
ncbi:MAG: c-type cytochrome [Prosthecobacter sp.]